MAFKLLPEKRGKYDKRVSPFSAICTDVKLQEGWGDDIKIVFEFGDDEPILSVNLNYSKWIDDGEGGLTPKQGSNAYKLFSSIVKCGVELDLDVDNFEVTTNPSLIGKCLSFDCKSKTFEIDGETKTYYVWTLTKVVDPNVLNVAPAKAPEAPKAVEYVDMATMRKLWK